MRKLFCMAMAFAISQLLFGAVVETRNAWAPPDRITLTWSTVVGGSNWTSYVTQPVRGTLSRVVILPGTVVPTGTTYSITLKDENGYDALCGYGASCASTTGLVTTIVPGVFQVYPVGTTNFYEGLMVNDSLTLTVTKVGTNRTGTVILYSE